MRCPKAVVAGVLLWALSATASAEAPREVSHGVPWLAESSTLIRVTVEALPDARMRRTEAKRASARRLARRFALRAIDAFVDRSLSRYALDLRRHAAVRAAIAEAVSVQASVALVDHGVRMTLQVPVDVIERVSGVSEIEWAR